VEHLPFDGGTLENPAEMVVEAVEARAEEGAQAVRNRDGLELASERAGAGLAPQHTFVEEHRE
jgi:hypothetical protein